MIYTSFDCVSSPKENEVSMNNIEWEIKAGDSKTTTNKKHPVYERPHQVKTWNCTE